ncbi:MAG TPA: PadR family transcriptional regulator [Microscillaceae bacterium]|nr:PadR family transcriptional regulator [Microscillaceae bacterium]
MSKHHLGEFEEIVMLTVAILHGKAYGVAIIEEIKERLERNVSIGSLQTVLKRLEDKGYLESELGEATKARGGKRKRYFKVTNLGMGKLKEAKEQRQNLWQAIPTIAFQN